MSSRGTNTQASTPTEVVCPSLTPVEQQVLLLLHVHVQHLLDGLQLLGVAHLGGRRGSRRRACGQASRSNKMAAHEDIKKEGA